jgi:predicted transcriptional regulator
MAATNFCSRIVVFLHIPIRFAFIATSAILTLSSLFAVQSNRSASRGNSSKTINRVKIEHTRDRFGVYVSMLESAINGGIKKSDILYEAYPDRRDFDAYMQHLVQNGLLIKEEYRSRTNGNGYYRTSNKGFVYIELYRELERLCPSLMICVSN